jgi:hypothetical protein
MLLEQETKIAITPTDPWDFVTFVGSGPFSGVVVQVDQDNYRAVILCLNKPICYCKNQATFFTASARHAGEDFRNEKGNVLFCNFISLTDAEGQSGIFQPNSKDERLRFIGDISLTIA